MLATIRKVWMLTLGYVLMSSWVQAQVSSPILDKYIAEAFASNEGVKQQNIQLDQALNALKQAKSYYYPNVSFVGDYVRAAGGRTIDLPIGDLMNPVYSTLNQLTHSSSFPTISNVSYQLNPDNYYDARVHTVMPLINTEIWYNEKINKVLIGKNQAALNVYKRELAKNIKDAYFRYYQATNAVVIYQNSLTLVNENVRVNKSLVKNGVKNNTVLLRSENEAEKLNASLTEAQNNVKNAQLYFNFLLNRNAEAEIVIDTTLVNNIELEIPAAPGAQREELLQLKTGIDAYTLSSKMAKSVYMPKVGTFLDLGSQGFKFKVDDKTSYFMWGLNLKWDIFAGGLNNTKIKNYELEQNAYQSRYDQAQRAFEMEQKQALNTLASNTALLKSAQCQLKLAQRYYNDELKLYKEGTAMYIELVDALNQLTTARLQESIARANILIARADIERKNALLNLESFNK